MIRKIPPPPKRKTRTKPDKNQARTDPFERALNLANKKYQKMELDRANAVEKIEAIDQAMPGLRNAIAGLESYFGMEPTFPDHELSQPRFDAEDLDNLRRNVPFERTIDREPEKQPGPPDPLPARRGRKATRTGQPSLYTCNKCGGFTASTDERPICSNENCLSADLELKKVSAPTPNNPGGGVGVIGVGLPPDTEQDDALLLDNITGVNAAP